MSRKLIKYEFKQMKSALLLTAIVFAIITGIVFCIGILPMLVFGIDESEGGILSIFLASISVLLYEVILIVTGIGVNIYIGVRFYKTMYSGIGYFTNTLPLKKHEIILSKIIPAAIAQTIVNLMKDKDRTEITNLLEYPADTAGGIMTTAYIAIREDLKVIEGLEKIREIGPKIEVIETIFVVNARGQLIGTADLRDILSSDKNILMADITKENFISVGPEMDQEEVAKLVSKYDLKAIPVVNQRMAILGIVTVDDIIDVIVEEYNEDILEMGGVSKEESLDTTLLQSIKLRLPWLLINLITAFMASFTVKVFEGTIAQVVALSSIMTIISGMGGNAGSQTQSILVRQIATDKVDFKRDWKSFVKEIFLGVINGTVNGLITAIIVMILYRNVFLGVITVIAMIGNLVVAGIFGFLVPVILDKFGADPAVSSSIFVTTATDVLGFFIFLGLANIFLPMLI